MEHKGVKISIFEGTKYSKDGVEAESQKLFYVAESEHGKSFANEAQKAFEGACEQIDKATKK